SDASCEARDKLEAAEARRDAVVADSKRGNILTHFGKAQGAAFGFVKESSGFSANIHDVNAKTHEKNATAAQKVAEDARDDMNEARRVQQSYIDMAKQIAQKQNDARLAIVRG